MFVQTNRPIRVLGDRSPFLFEVIIITASPFKTRKYCFCLDIINLMDTSRPTGNLRRTSMNCLQAGLDRTVGSEGLV